jgi:hypothetical protein
VPTPTPAPTPPPASGRATIEYIEFNPDGDDVLGEYVLIRNPDATPVTMTGWRVRDNDGAEYVFPAFTLHGGATVRVWTGSGTNDANNLYWGRGLAVWTNTGDVGYLYRTDGVLVDSYAYQP